MKFALLRNLVPKEYMQLCTVIIRGGQIYRKGHSKTWMLLVQCTVQNDGLDRKAQGKVVGDMLKEDIALKIGPY